MISVSNGNHMLNANTTSSMSAPSGSCDAVPLPCTYIHAHSTPPPTTSDVASFVSHGVSSSAQSTLLFHVRRLFLSPPPTFFFCVCLQLFCHSNRHSLTLQTSYDRLCFNPLPDVDSSGTDLVVVKNPLRWLYRFTSVANQLFYCNRGAALMRGGLFW